MGDRPFLTRIELLCIFQRKAANLEGVGGLWLAIDGVRGIGSRGKRGEGPNTTIAKIHHDLGIDLLTIVRSAHEKSTGLEEVIRIGRLCENGVRRTDGTEDEREK
jgi:hypothetical protein